MTPVPTDGLPTGKRVRIPYDLNRVTRNAVASLEFHWIHS